MRKKRGFLLVMALMLVVLLVIVGLAFLGKKALQYRTATRAQVAAQAKALAEAGLDDFRIKMQRDLAFPPIGEDQQNFTYKEVLRDGSTVVGTYSVTVTASYLQPAYCLYVVTSTGEAGSDDRGAFARRSLRIEVDMSKKLRDDPSVDNPNYYKVINYQDLGGL